MSSRRRDDETQPFNTTIAGNELYLRSMFAIGMHGYAVSSVLRDTLRAIGSSPDAITIEELAAMMPEIERRLLLLAPHAEVAGCMGRLRKLVFDWDGP
jgi:hypothetical protein